MMRRALPSQLKEKNIPMWPASCGWKKLVFFVLNEFKRIASLRNDAQVS